MSADSSADLSAKKPKSGWLNIAVDYGPLLVFFAVYKYYSPSGEKSGFGEIFAVLRATSFFMVSAIIALAVSKFKLGRVSPMLWLSTALIVIFGGITLWTQNPKWIQHKPTFVYLIFALSLIIGHLKGKPLLKYLLDAAFEGLNDAGWMKLSRNWGYFFIFLAVLNEGIIFYADWEYPGPFLPNEKNPAFDLWIAAKLWVFMPLSFLFTFIQIPMLLRHGMAEAAEGEVLSDPPHE